FSSRSAWLAKALAMVRSPSCCVHIDLISVCHRSGGASVLLEKDRTAPHRRLYVDHQAFHGLVAGQKVDLFVTNLPSFAAAHQSMGVAAGVEFLCTAV